MEVKARPASAAMLSLMLSVAVAGCGSSAESGSGDGCTVVFGANTEVSGSWQTYGKPAAQGLEAAAEDINEAGGVKVGSETCEFVASVADNKSDPAQVYTAAQANNDAGSVAVLGPGVSPDVAYATYKKAGVIDFATSPGLLAALKADPEGHPYLASMIPEQVAERVTWFNQALAAKPDITRVALVYPSDEQGESTNASNLEALEQIDGVELVSNEAYSPNTSDYSTLLTKVKASQPDLLFTAGTTTQDPAIFAQASGLGVAKYYMSSVLTPDAVLAEPSLADVPVLLATFAPTYSDAMTLPDQNPEEIFGSGPAPAVPAAGIVVYYAAWLLKQAVEDAGTTDGDKVLDALGGQRYDGPMGTCEMTEDRFLTCGTAFIVVEGGELAVSSYDSAESTEPNATYTCSEGTCTKN